MCVAQTDSASGKVIGGTSDRSEPTASTAEVAATFIALAAGELSEDELADWFRQRLPSGES